MDNPENRPTTIPEYEKWAKETLSTSELDYIEAAAGDKWTKMDNKEAFNRYSIHPRVFHTDVSHVDTTTTVQGHRIGVPVCLVPTGIAPTLLKQDGDIAIFRAAKRTGVIATLPVFSFTSYHELQAAVPNSLKWFQLYLLRDRGLTERIVRRAEECGFKCLVLTVDTPVTGSWAGRRRRDVFTSMQLARRFPNFADLDLSSLSDYLRRQLDSSATWSSIQWLKSISKVPIVVKGVLTGADGELAVQAGVDGIIVSNHGGRQLDDTPASIDALSEVVDAVRGRCEVYMDGGVRGGRDVFKALAMGARAVFIGKASLWGLACEGENGVAQVITILKEELTNTMALAGTSSIQGIKKTMVKRKPCSCNTAKL